MWTTMKGDVALAGFLLTAEEWAQLDPDARSQLLSAALRPEPSASPVPQRPAIAVGSGPVAEPK
jgi:hypothetical protein